VCAGLGRAGVVVASHISDLVMRAVVDVRAQKWCIWCGPLMIVICALGLFGLADFVPPPSPLNDARAITGIFAAHRDLTRLGLVLNIFGAAFFAPWIAAISAQMTRTEGRQAPLAYAQLALGACLIMEFAFPMMALLVAAYRDDRPEQIVLAGSDWGWMPTHCSRAGPPTSTAGSRCCSCPAPSWSSSRVARSPGTGS
jgi:hypothetical protein